jgi:hypothetical protein
MSLLKFARKPSLKKVAQMPTPVIITVLILTCMLIVFTIESLGLSNRSKNVELRELKIENSKKLFNLAILQKIEKTRESTSLLSQEELIGLPKFQFKAIFDKQEFHNKILYESVMFNSEEEFFDI